MSAAQTMPVINPRTGAADYSIAAPGASGTPCRQGNTTGDRSLQQSGKKRSKRLTLARQEERHAT